MEIDVEGRQYILNVKPSLPDLRDWRFVPPEGLEVSDVIELDQAWPIDIRRPFDQGNEGSCTANAQSKLWDITAYAQNLTPITPSRRFIYYTSRFLEGTSNVDAGSTIGDSIKGMALYGACNEQELPYIPGEFTRVPTSQQAQDALANQVLKYENVAQTADAIGAVLALKRPISIGFVVYQNFVPDGQGVIPMPSGGVYGGHNVLIVGRNHTARLFKIFNSWGSWARSGFAWIPYDYILNPRLCFELRTIDLVEGTPTPLPAPILDGIGAHWPTGEIRQLWPNAEPYPSGIPDGIGTHYNDQTLQEVWPTFGQVHA